MSLANIRLLYGAWVDGSSWGAVIERFQEVGSAPGVTSRDADAATVRQPPTFQNAPVMVPMLFQPAGVARLIETAAQAVTIVA